MRKEDRLGGVLIDFIRDDKCFIYCLFQNKVFMSKTFTFKQGKDKSYHLTPPHLKLTETMLDNKWNTTISDVRTFCLDVEK